MTDRTIDFPKHLLAELSHPLDKDGMIRMLHSLSKEDEIIWGYVDNLYDTIKNLNVWRDILSSAPSNMERCEKLIDSLDENQLNNFSQIMISLQQVAEHDDFSGIADALWNFQTPTNESIEKASKLLTILEDKKDADLEEIARKIFQLGAHLRMLGYVFFAHRNKNFDEESAIKIGGLHENELDILIQLTNSIMNDSIINLNKINDL